jgi:hypothetical protein
VSKISIRSRVEQLVVFGGAPIRNVAGQINEMTRQQALGADSGSRVGDNDEPAFRTLPGGGPALGTDIIFEPSVGPVAAFATHPDILNIHLGTPTVNGPNAFLVKYSG